MTGLFKGSLQWTKGVSVAEPDQNKDHFCTIVNQECTYFLKFMLNFSKFYAPSARILQALQLFIESGENSKFALYVFNFSAALQHIATVFLYIYVSIFVKNCFVIQFILMAKSLIGRINLN